MSLIDITGKLKERQNSEPEFTFENLRMLVWENFDKLVASGQLYYVEIDRDDIWIRYQEGFAEDKRQEHNCNACKSFLRQFGGIVAIVEGKKVSIWDNLESKVSDEYLTPILNLARYVYSRPITDIFLTEQQKCGVRKNLDSKSGVTWTHFFLEVPKCYVAKDIAPKLAETRDNKNVLQRSLVELTVDATESILELIGQNSLYKGKEYEPILKRFQQVQKEYAEVAPAEQDNFCWLLAVKAGTAFCRIRNTAIGTLLIDVSEGLDLDSAVTKFERVVAPTNYKRPTSLVTPKMVEQAKETLAVLGLLESLERRYANETDINVSDILFADRPAAITDVFDMVAKDTLVNPRTFSKVEEIGIEDFLANVVPTAKSIQVLVENPHQSNLVSLITAQDKNAPTLFKWPNSFSWNYTGAITDSIKERVKEAGGHVEGELRTSLSWSNYDDLDIHVNEPNGNEIAYFNKNNHASGARLDVDMNAMSPQSRTPVENIIWADKTNMQEGVYTVFVDNYFKRENDGVGFTVQVECAGEMFDFEFHANPRHEEMQKICAFSYSKKDGIKFEGETKSNVVSREKWGIKTNQFHKVTKLMLSPNHWGERGIGNKHYLFMLQDCACDETPRPFFNEFLKQDLDKHRKVFEILGSKVKIEDTKNQLAGLGFSDTKRASLIAKVTGKFTRILRVNF